MINFIDGAIEDFLDDKASLSEIDISFEMPTKAWSGGLTKTTVNLYLFDLRENTELRDSVWALSAHGDGTVTQKKAPVRIDLFYMGTVYSVKEKKEKILEEHRLLGSILSAVHTYAFIPENPYLIDNLPEATPPLPRIPIEAVHPKFLDEQGGMQLWSAVDQFMKPAVFIKVTVPIGTDRSVDSRMVLAKVIEYTGPSETYVRLGGIVTDGGSGPTPIEGAKMSLQNSSGKEVDRTQTDAEGKFLFQRVADGSYTIEIDAEGFQIRRVEIAKASEVKKEKLIIAL